jgi:hypothetical protein
VKTENSDHFEFILVIWASFANRLAPRKSDIEPCHYLSVNHIGAIASWAVGVFLLTAGCHSNFTAHPNASQVFLSLSKNANSFLSTTSAQSHPGQ